MAGEIIALFGCLGCIFAVMSCAVFGKGSQRSRVFMDTSEYCQYDWNGDKFWYFPLYSWLYIMDPGFGFMIVIAIAVLCAIVYVSIATKRNRYYYR